MAELIDTDVNITELQRLYEDNSVARTLLDHFASVAVSDKASYVNSLESLMIKKSLAENVTAPARKDIVEVLKVLEDAGCGTFWVGKNDWSSRFNWRVEMNRIGKAAANAANANGHSRLVAPPEPVAPPADDNAADLVEDVYPESEPIQDESESASASASNESAQNEWDSNANADEAADGGENAEPLAESAEETAIGAEADQDAYASEESAESEGSGDATVATELPHAFPVITIIAETFAPGDAATSGKWERVGELTVSTATANVDDVDVDSTLAELWSLEQSNAATAAATNAEVEADDELEIEDDDNGDDNGDGDGDEEDDASILASDGMIPNEGIDEEGFLTHVFRLRPELSLVFRLPADMTRTEARRLAGFFRSIPFQ